MELYYHFTNLSEKPTMMLALDMVCRLDHCLFLHFMYGFGFTYIICFQEYQVRTRCRILRYSHYFYQ